MLSTTTSYGDYWFIGRDGEVCLCRKGRDAAEGEGGGVCGCNFIKGLPNNFVQILTVKDFLAYKSGFL